MAGIVEKIAKTPAVLAQPSGKFVDGKPEMLNVNCLAFVMGGEQSQLVQIGTTIKQKTVLLAPLRDEPVLPAKLTIDNTLYDVASVKTVRNMSGVVVGHKLVLV